MLGWIILGIVLFHYGHPGWGILAFVAAAFSK